MIRGKGFKMRENGFILGIRKKCLTVRLLGHQHDLPTAAVDVPFLKVLENKFLSQALSNRVN